jgi:penicillin-insensitive murein DD-endopeptidase
MTRSAQHVRRLLWSTVATLLVCTPVAYGQSSGDEPVPAPEAIGTYAAGCLVGAAQLPSDGIGYQAIRLERHRHYGHPELIRFIEALAEQANAAGLGLLPVGDMSQARGGPLTSDHASHQIGLDVDIFLRLDLPRLPQGEREDLDLPSVIDFEQGRLNERFSEANIELIRLAASAPNVERIFVSPPIKQAMCMRQWPDRSFLRRLRPWYGHDDHFHVRLACPPGSADCVPQAAPPPGDGCGTELDSWLERGPIPASSSAQRRAPTLPQRCDMSR